jgi:hypothetical protein
LRGERKESIVEWQGRNAKVEGEIWPLRGTSSAHLLSREKPEGGKELKMDEF